MADALLAAAITGGLVYLLGLWIHQKTRKALDESRAGESRFRSLTELSADWFWETDAEHRITWLSGGGPVATFFGATPTYGRRFWEIPRVEADPRALEAVLERLGRREPFFDLEIARSDERGARQIHIVSGHSRHAADGRFLGYRGVGRDVTGERRAESALSQAKERLELALEGGNLAEWDYDLGSDDIYLGSGWAGFLGRSRSPGVHRGRELAQLVHPHDRPAVLQAFVRALKGEAPFVADCRVQRQDGGWKWLHVSGEVTERDGSRRAKRMSGTVADIEDRKRVESALRETEQRYRDLAGVSGEYLWETDAGWRYTYLSERVEAILGYSRAELLGRTPKEFMPLGEAHAVDEWLASRGGEGRGFRELVHRSITKSGGAIWQSISAVPRLDADGRCIGYRGTAADVTARKQAEARIEQLVTRDTLTGLPNRSLLAERASQAIGAAVRGRSQLALLAVGLDRFGLVNESLGHQAGDALLRAVAERLQNLHRDGLARLGGDEFVFLQPVKTADDAAVLASRILGVLARPFTIEGNAMTVGASIGIALYPGDGRDFAELARNADTALAHAKDCGGGSYRFFSPALGARARQRLRVENELRGALARGELVLHWHPVLRGRSAIVGAEALVRWQHPSRGLLLPEEFVPLAEDCGLIRAVGEWTLERAISQAAAWQRLPGNLCFAVNVSAAELAEGDAFVRRLQSSLEANALDGARLELEVTERVLMPHLAENVEVLRRIGELGVRFAIDDFGTGYSSLAYLRRLPIDKLKIDRMFVHGIDSDPADEAVVRTIAALGRTLGLSVAAEGVENAAQLERLLAAGCEEWQGHCFAAPLDAAGFEALLTSGSAPKAATI